MTQQDMPSQEELDQFEGLVVYLKRTRGFDFSGYKSASLMRRILKRMEIIKIASMKDYTDYLEVHPEEFALLFNHLLINVTSFFRDQPAWDFLKQEVLPKLIKSREGDSIRIWSAGCASGQEPYSLAILFCELMGVEAFQQRVKIYASDVDQEALVEARTASYSPKDVQELDQKILDTYFEQVGERFSVRADLRRAVIFGRHDLIGDAPISRLDLLVCRNTLMYFNAETQNRILARFHFALSGAGYLFLGKAEMLLTHANLFNPIELKYRIFMKVANVTLRDRLLLINQIGDEDGGTRLTRQWRMRELAYESVPLAQLVIDYEGNLVLANDHARVMFSFTANDFDRPFRDLEVSFRPVELRAPIEQAYSGRKRVHLKDVQRTLPGGALQFLDIEIVPLFENGSKIMGAAITFHDVSRTFQLQGEVQRSKQELETAYEELQSTNEELETTNEELQSTVEELETTNEELQSTNEELETMNEELQSTNEELQTVNNELRERTDDLQRANLFQESILESMQSGVVVLDGQLHVQIWNEEAEDLWGLRADEVKGRSFVNLDIGLPVSQLAETLRSCQDGQSARQSAILNAVNRRGKSITCRVTCSPLKDHQARSAHGIIVFMEEWDGKRLPDKI